MTRMLNIFEVVLIAVLLSGCNHSVEVDPVATVHKSVVPITMASLLDEMVSFDESVYYPSPYYTSSQASSTDMRSTSPDKPYWFANKDNTRYIRIDNDNEDGRYEKVIFDQTCPGVITRIWTAGIASSVELRFYFDDEKSPRFTLKGNDLTKLPFDVPEGLVQKHLHYDSKGGTSLHLPIPYGKGCRITLFPTTMSLAYHINYRSYEAGTDVETFTLSDAESNYDKMVETVGVLNNPPSVKDPVVSEFKGIVPKGGSRTLALPAGENAVRNFEVKIKNFADHTPEVLMRKLILRISFDDNETVWTPLGDFTGGGIGSRAVDSWWLDADGKGTSTSRWVMPYKKSGVITIENVSPYDADIELTVGTTEWKWYENTLYFHCSWRQEGVAYKSDYESNNNEEWLFSSLAGRGVYKGDVLSLFNYGGQWYGEGDEKIYVDGEKFPSHFGTGTEDYYDTSFAPVTVYQTPFGGAIRADSESSYGYNTFLRTRNLDGITFGSSLKFNFELLGWSSGTAIYSSTVFWYGDAESTALQTSANDEINRKIPY